MMTIYLSKTLYCPSHMPKSESELGTETVQHV